MMAGARYVLDANILTAILKRDPVATGRVNSALQSNAEFVMCPVVFYEVYRGLLHKDARKQLGFLLHYIGTYTWDDLKRPDWEQAAELWAELRRKGVTASDADLLIAAYAIQRRATVVTDNTDHFLPLGAPVENWLR